MTHRDRVFSALNHEKTDRPPMQISFTPEFAKRLKEDLTENNGIKFMGENQNPHGGGNTYELETCLGEDMLLTSVGWANSYYSGENNEDYLDEWGVGWHYAQYETPFGNGHYTEVASFPLSDDNDISKYKVPDPLREELYEDAKHLIANYKKEYFITGVTVTTIFETAWALRGLDKLLMDFVTDIDLAKTILDIPYNYHLTAAKKLVEMGVDMIWIGDDVGAQNNMIISPSMWRQILKPYMASFIGELKRINKNVKVAYHSDGNIYEIIPDLIDIGLDVLNPIQPASMDPAKIKNLYGNKLCFWGTIDEQHTLPFGSTDDVISEVKQRRQTVGKNGGLILGPTHHVQLDTPLPNFYAMLKECLKVY